MFKKIAFGDNFKRFSVVRKVFYTFLYHKKALIERSIEESGIVGFCLNFNKNAVLFFHSSLIYRSCVRLNVFFKEVILKNADASRIVKFAKMVFSSFTIAHLGIFIIMIVSFNTFFMLCFKKPFDIFSIFGRAAFVIFGFALILKKDKPNI